MKTKETVPVSNRALIQRINRRYKKMGNSKGVGNYQLKTSRFQNTRKFYILNLNKNHAEGVELEKLGREMGALKKWEHLYE